MARRHRIRKALKSIGSAIGQAAFWIAPTYIGRRVAWKRALDAQSRVLSQREAANTSDRFRGAKWLTSRLSPDSEAELELTDVRQRARDLYLNDPVAAGYVRGRVTNVVGTGIRPQARIRSDQTNGITDQRAQDLNTRIEGVWGRWAAKASRCGRRPFWTIQRLAERCVDREGEALVVLSDKAVAGKPVPLCVEVVSIQRLETPAVFEGEQHPNGRPKVRLGIEREPDGTPTAYYLRRADPDDTKHWSELYDRVLAERVVHIYDDEDPGQSRGWPAMVPSMPSLKDIKDLDEAHIIKRQMEACFGIVIRGSGSPVDAAVAAATNTNSNSQRLQEMVPGMVHYAGPCDAVETVDPGQGSGADHNEYLRGRYQRVAAGLNIPVEYLLRAYGGTNYSSGRLSLLDVRADAKVGQKFLIDLLIVKVWERFVEECVLADLVNISAAEYLKAPHVYTASVSIPPTQDWVDPVKEVLAAEEAVDEGFASRSEIVQGRGHDDEEVQEQRLREKMRDADNERRLRDYRTKLGLDPMPAEKGAASKSRDDSDRKDDEEDDAGNGKNKGNGRFSRRDLVALAIAGGD